MVKRVSSILGPDGKPIEYDVDVLGRDITTPVLGGVRQLMDGHPAQGLDPVRLARIMRDAEQGNAQAQHELAEEIEEKDLHYQGVLGTRKRAVAQLDITVEAASDDDPEDQDNADFVRAWLDRDTLEDELFDILDAVGKGFSATEVIWDLGDKAWLPIGLERADQRFFEFDPIDGKTLRLKGGVDGTAGLPEELKAFKYIIHAHPAKSGLAIRGGLIRGIAWAYLFKNIALKDWTIFAEIYGQPLRVGKYGPSSTNQERAALLRAVQDIGTDAAAIIPASMMIEFTNGMAAGNYEVYFKLLTYLDDLESKAVLGQTGTTDAKPAGLGSGLGNVHNEVRGDIKRSDAKKLAATINKTLVRWIVDFNKGPPKSGAYPRVKIGQSDVFTKEDMDILGDFVDRGGEVEMSVVRDRIGYPDPPEKAKDGKPVKLMKPAAKASPNPAPVGQAGPAPGPEGAAAATLASEAGLQGLMRGLKLGRALSMSPGAPADAIDAAVADMADQWQPVMAPMFDPLQKAFDAATSYEDLKTRLLAAVDKMDVRAMAELLAEAQFMARMAGDSGNALQ